VGNCACAPKAEKYTGRVSRADPYAYVRARQNHVAAYRFGSASSTREPIRHERFSGGGYVQCSRGANRMDGTCRGCRSKIVASTAKTSRPTSVVRLLALNDRPRTVSPERQSWSENGLPFIVRKYPFFLFNHPGGHRPGPSHESGHLRAARFGSVYATVTVHRRRQVDCFRLAADDERFLLQCTRVTIVFYGRRINVVTKLTARARVFTTLLILFSKRKNRKN